MDDKIAQFLGAKDHIDYSKSSVITVNSDITVVDEQYVNEHEDTNDITQQLDEVKLKNIIDDYEYVHTNIRDVIRLTMGLLSDAIEVARETENPKSYDSVSILVEKISALNKDLLEINKIEKKTSKEQQGTNITNNTAIICSPEDILKKLSNMAG